jgi:peptide/nickel transport system permease protein
MSGLTDALAAPEKVLSASESRSRGRAVARVFLQNKLAVAAVVVLVLIILFCYVGPVIYHTNQVTTNIGEANLRPSAAHPLGTNEVGYDTLGRLMLGGQSSLEIGFAAALLASLLGTVWGATAGFFGGIIDSVMMRVVDSLLSIPALILVLLLASVFTPTIPVLILVVAMVSWLGTARLVRGETLTIRVREYVQAARVSGVRNGTIIARHVVRNVVGTIVVQTTFEVANAILLLAALGYLGLGPPPPAANWGAMLSDGLNYVYAGYWWLIYPAGVAIVLTVVCFNYLGDALRDAFEVRLRDR